MKKYSKIFVALLAVALLLCLATLTLVACDGLLGGGKDGTTPGGNPESEIEMTPVEEFEFAQLENGAYEIKKYTGDRTKIKIPSEYDGQAITGIGDEAFRDCTDIQAVVVPDSVTSIGRYAFRGCKGLQSATINAQSIGEYIFYGCSNLQTLTMGESVTHIADEAFYNCRGITKVNYLGDLKSWCEIEFRSDTSNPLFCSDRKVQLYCNGELIDLTNLNIPQGVTSIGNYAFCVIRMLSVTIPDSVTNIGEYAFSGCSKLVHKRNLSGVNIQSYSPEVEVLTTEDAEFQNKLEKDENGIWTYTVGDTVYAIGYEGENENLDLSLNDSITAIYQYAFNRGESTASIVIPDSLTSIDSYTFYNCRGLKKVTIGNGVQSIGSYAFFGCAGLSEITIPDSVTSIGSSAFYECTGLQTVIIGENVQSISGLSFSYCPGITKVSYLGNLKSWCEIEFGDTPLNGTARLYVKENEVEKEVAGDVNIPSGTTKIGYYAFHGLTGITSVTIPDSVKSIDNMAFLECTGLQSVTIGKGVQSIGNEAFSDCTGLQTITIPDSVQSIGGNAFYGCTGLKEITIPNSVKSIGEQAFYECTGLQTVTIGEGLQSIGDYAFRDCTGLKDIFYVGNETQWGQITKGYKWDQYFTHSTNGRLECYTIEYQLHYNSTGPEA